MIAMVVKSIVLTTPGVDPPAAKPLIPLLKPTGVSLLACTESPKSA